MMFNEYFRKSDSWSLQKLDEISPKILALATKDFLPILWKNQSFWDSLLEDGIFSLKMKKNNCPYELF